MRGSCSGLFHKSFSRGEYKEGFLDSLNKDEYGFRSGWIDYTAKNTQQNNEIDHAYCNLALLSTLDKVRHRSYFKTRASIINENKDYLRRVLYKYNTPKYEKTLGPLLNIFITFIH